MVLVSVRTHSLTVAHFRYDVVFDPVFDSLSRRSANLLKHWRGSTYISITNPLLNECDQRGLALGFLSSATTFSKDFFKVRADIALSLIYVAHEWRLIKKCPLLSFSYSEMAASTLGPTSYPMQGSSRK